MTGMDPQATPTADARLQGLQDWLQQGVGLEYHSLAPASADASFRRYFRIETADGSFIVMDAPPEQEDCRPFLRISALLTELGLHVPEVLQQDLAQGYLLLTDLGTDMYLPALNESTVDSLYGDAMAALLRLQAHGPADLPPYDRALLLQEMALFRDWYLQRHLGLEPDAEAERILDTAFGALADAALQQPVVIVHRDYHSRNLMISQPNPGILDFQDAVNGPLTYDLVSLLRDCYIAWPRARVEAWVADYHRQLCDAGIVSKISAEQFLRWFDWMGIQRHLKASGIFARLNYRDGKAGYLEDIPRTLAYVSEVGADYQELRGFVSLLTEWQGSASGTGDGGRGTREVS